MNKDNINILLFGGSGLLGTQLQKDDSNIYAPSREICDITCKKSVHRLMFGTKPNVVIHAAAIVGLQKCEQNKELAWRVNVEGVRNVVEACKKINARLIFISTNTVFDGTKIGGLYTETDIPNPQFYYAITKLVAEQCVGQYQQSAIVRTDFYSHSVLKYKKVFTDHYTSKISVELLSQRLLRLVNSDFTGIINIGGERKSLFDILAPMSPEIVPISIKDSSISKYPRDLSLSCEKWNKEFSC